MRLYAELARSNAMLQRERNNKLMNLEAVVAAIAHEVRQPLTAISASGSAARRFLETEPPDLGEARSSVDHLVEDTHRLSEVFQNIRALFGRAEQPMRAVDVNALVLDVLRTIESDLRGHGIRTVLRLQSELPPVLGHRGQLQEVVYNLVGNATEAMQAAERPRILTITTGLDPGGVVLAVQDTGPGIGPNEAEAIFDAFVSTKPDGIGLGLAICRLIVERHGGRLSVSAADPPGAVFEIGLPRAVHAGTRGEDGRTAKPSPASLQGNETHISA
jgi:signal transduction histidine kinase